MEKFNSINERLQPGQCLILLFHGVVERHSTLIRNYTRKHIQVDFFKKLLKELKNRGQALSMDDCVKLHMSRERYPDFSFVVTFDDGFENNFTVAAPVLEELKIPATFYVSTDFIENNTMSWIDRIEFMLEATLKAKQFKSESGNLKNSLSFRLPWENRIRNIWTKSEAIDVLTDIRSRVKNDSQIDSHQLIEDLASQWNTEVPQKSDGDLDKKMSWSQVTELSKNSLFTVGGHSHRHLNLAFLQSADMRREIDQSLALLHTHLGVRTKHYCYPEGLENCYNSEIIAYLKSKGIVASPSAIDGINSSSTDLFHLKRVMVLD